MRNRVLLATLLSCVLGATSTHAQSPSAADAQSPSVTLPPALDRVLRDYERAWKSADATALAALFAENGFVLQNGRAPVRGRAAIAAQYRGQGGGTLRLRALGYAAGDTAGYIIGAYGYGEGADVPDMGKYTLTLRRDRGGPWQIFSDMDNANQPRRPAAPAPASP
jgi:ketosteroid isomerase-like protein